MPIAKDDDEWAGEFRAVQIGNGEHGFAPADQLEGFSELILGLV